MLLADFDYILPRGLIAQYPLPSRDSSRLLVVQRRAQKISHRLFKDFAGYLEAGDAVILNNTKVTPMRLLGNKKDTLGRVDLLLIKRLSAKRYSVLSRPCLKIGQEIVFNRDSLKACHVEKGILEFDRRLSQAELNKFGLMPLPPYIKRQPDLTDRARYQTVYALKPGAIASPTAGLHFTKEILKKIKEKKVNVDYLTLHVGLGTFKPIRCSDIRSHKMEAEEFSIPKAAIKTVARTKRQGGRVFAIGTTTTRALETAAELFTPHPECLPALQRISEAAREEWHSGGIPPHGRNPENKGAAGVNPWGSTIPSCAVSSCKGLSDIFIYPGYEFKAVDCLLTNFHLPKTTLFILVCAFAGRDLIMQAYQEAIREKYRFYSYGDAMLII